MRAYVLVNVAPFIVHFLLALKLHGELHTCSKVFSSFIGDKEIFIISTMFGNCIDICLKTALSNGIISYVFSSDTGHIQPSDTDQTIFRGKLTV